MRRALNVERLLVITILVCLSYGFLSLWRIKNPKAAEPQAVAAAIGRKLTANDFVGKSPSTAGNRHPSRTLVYIFATTCHFCESQRNHIGEILARLPSTAVITASIEPDSLTERYWSDKQIKLAMPSQLAMNALTNIGLSGVPALLVVDGDGRITSAYIGTALGWNQRKFEKLLGDRRS